MAKKMKKKPRKIAPLSRGKLKNAKKKAVKKTAKKARAKKEKLTGKKAAKREIDLRALSELIERGRGRGFVTDGEVLNYFPHVEEDIGFLEEIYDKLDEAQIKVVETTQL